MGHADSNIKIYDFLEGYHTEDMFLEKSCTVKFPLRVYTKGMEICLYIYNYFVFEFKM